MPTSPKPTTQHLRAELLADGARPHARMSDLSRYMLENFEEMQALREEGFSWEAIARNLTKKGFVNREGQPISAELAKLTWSRRLHGRRKKSLAPQATASEATAPNTTAREPAARTAPPLSATTEKNALPFAEFERPQIDIQPARLRGTPAAPAAHTNSNAVSTPSLLSKEEVDRRLAELAERQGGLKIPLPRVL
jgi:hypothetical protein